MLAQYKWLELDLWIGSFSQGNNLPEQEGDVPPHQHGPPGGGDWGRSYLTISVTAQLDLITLFKTGFGFSVVILQYIRSDFDLRFHAHISARKCMQGNSMASFTISVLASKSQDVTLQTEVTSSSCGLILSIISFSTPTPLVYPGIFMDLKKLKGTSKKNIWGHLTPSVKLSFWLMPQNHSFHNIYSQRTETIPKTEISHSPWAKRSSTIF